MEKSAEKVFKTKTGYCHVLPDKILITRDGVIGSVANVTVGKGMTRILLIYGGLSLFLLYTSLHEYKDGNSFQSLFSLLLGIFLLYGIIKSANNSATPVILRSQIREIKFIRGVEGVTRSRFEVFFYDERKKIKRRMIMLPGSMTGRREATENALRIMTEENLIN